MLGSQRNSSNSSDNPFSGYQNFYLNLYALVLGPNDEGYQKGVNDQMYFNAVLTLDEQMKRNPKIMERARSSSTSSNSAYYTLGRETSLNGVLLKSLYVKEDTINGKKTKRLIVTVFDPNAIYTNPFEDIDGDNPNNGKVTGAIYQISSSFTMKGKELINKLANLKTNEPFDVFITQAKEKDDDGKYTIPIKTKTGQLIYNINIRQNEQMVMSRFGDPEKLSSVVNDEWNEQFLSILNDEELDPQEVRLKIDKFFTKFITNNFSDYVFAEMFLPYLQKEMGYNLVENGRNQDGTPRMKYVRIDGVDSKPQFDEDVMDYDTDEPEAKGVTFSADDEELPF